MHVFDFGRVRKHFDFFINVNQVGVKRVETEDGPKRDSRRRPRVEPRVARTHRSRLERDLIRRRDLVKYFLIFTSILELFNLLFSLSYLSTILKRYSMFKVELLWFAFVSMSIDIIIYWRNIKTVLYQKYVSWPFFKLHSY